MGDTTKRIRENLKKPKQVRIWFWDGQREYNGNAVLLTADKFEGSFLVSEGPQKAIHLGPALLHSVGKYLTNRIVDFKVNGGGWEVTTKGTVTGIDSDPQNPDWVIIGGVFQPTRDTDRGTLTQIGTTIQIKRPKI